MLLQVVRTTQGQVSPETVLGTGRFRPGGMEEALGWLAELNAEAEGMRLFLHLCLASGTPEATPSSGPNSFSQSPSPATLRSVG